MPALPEEPPVTHAPIDVAVAVTAGLWWLPGLYRHLTVDRRDRRQLARHHRRTAALARAAGQ
jgi:hypothetical protein